VWSADYGGVWHLGEATTDEGSGAVHADSTGHGYDGTQDGNDDVPGLIGSAQEFDGTNDVINVSASQGFNPSGDITLSGWFKLDSAFSGSSGSLLLMEKYLENINWNMHIMLTGLDYEEIGVPDGSLVFKLENGNDHYRWSQLTRSWIADNWYYFAILLDVSQLSNTQIFINGSDDTGSSSGTLTSGNLGYSSAWGIGGDQTDRTPTDLAWFDGLLDEIRVATALRSAAWIATEYNNQADPASFFSIAQEEGYSEGWADGSFTRRKEIVIDANQVGSETELRILRPSGAGASTGLNVYGASSNWQAVDEATSDGGTSYVHRGADTWGYDFYTTPDIELLKGARIHSVTIKFNGRQYGATGTTYGRTMLRTHSQNDWGTTGCLDLG
jgi:hypothetical protein